jgi:HK97 family phage prohead protease
MLTKRLAGALEVKAVAEDGSFSGHGSVFGVRDSYGDVVEPGAFAASLDAWKAKGKLPKLLLQHDPRNIVGKWTTMREDSRGLYVEGKLFTELPIAKSTHALMKHGELDGLSIGFVIPKGGEEFDQAAGVNRIKAVDLWEVSIVTFAANPAATVEAVKSMGPRDIERFLRDAGGMTRAEARSFMASGWKGIAASRDAEGGEEGNEPGRSRDAEAGAFKFDVSPFERALLGR